MPKRQRQCENGVATFIYGNMTPFSCHFYVVFGVVSSLLNPSIMSCSLLDNGYPIHNSITRPDSHMIASIFSGRLHQVVRLLLT